MASTYSPSLRIELIGAGDQAGTWNTTTNSNLGTLIESAIAGYVSVSVTSANQAFTALDGAVDQARNAVIALTTTTGANFNVYAPPQEKTYIIDNTSAFTATIFNSTVIGNTTAAGTGIAVPAGKKLVVFSDATNFYTIEAANLTGVLAVVNGGTGVTTSTGTGNTVLSTSPTLVTPILGTPTSGTLTNATGLPISTGVSGLGAGVATFLATPSSANLAAALTDETGSGANVFATSPTLVTPILGTPQSATLTNATGLPLTTGVTGTLPVANGGTGVATSTGTGNTVLSTSPTLTSPTLITPALGTPASGTLDNCTSNTETFGTNNTQLATTAFVQAALQALHPVGSIYINATNATNPGTLLGFGTWTAFGAGRVPVGFNAGNPLFDASEETGGSADSTLPTHNHTATSTVTDPSHAHTYDRPLGQVGYTQGGSQSVPYPQSVSTSSAFTGITVATSIANAGSSGTNANYQPYITVYMWKRTV